MNTLERLNVAARERITTFSAGGNSFALFGVFVIATLMLGTGVFVSDAAGYWGSAERMVAGTSVVTDMTFRGALSPIVYVPAAAVSAVLGPQFGPFAVLLQNALVLSAAAVFLMPKLADMLAPERQQRKLASVFLFWIVTVGFAPYPLMDLYPVLALLVMLVLVQSRIPMPILLAGVLAGLSINLRPAYLIPVILVTLVVVVWRRWHSLIFIAGAVLALLPQILLNVFAFKEWTIWPIASNGLIALQANYASFVIRYDTFLGAAADQQFYCSPAMAAQLQAPLPISPGELASTFLTNMPNSVVFSLQKIAAAFQWPLSNPYNIPSPGLDWIFALTITTITVVGSLALLRIAIGIRAPWTSNTWFGRALVAALMIGSVLTLVSSATETRFGLPLVLLGVVGCMTLPKKSVRSATSHDKVWLAVALFLIVVVSFFGYKGISHPAPAGPADQSVCAALL